MSRIKTTLTLYLIFQLYGSLIMAQVNIDDINALKGDIMILYKVSYERELTEKMKSYPHYVDEIVVHYNRKMILKRSVKQSSGSRYKQRYDLINRDKNILYDCMEYTSGYKFATYEDVPLPTIEASKKGGQTKLIAGQVCEKYTSRINGRDVAFYASGDLGIDYTFNFQAKGVGLEIPGYNKYLGHYIIKAVSIEQVNLPKDVYSLGEFMLTTKEEYEQTEKERLQEYAEKKEHFKEHSSGSKFPSYRFDSFAGTKVLSKELTGKVVVYNFYYAGCQPCVKEAPLLSELKNKYADRQVEFIAITFDEEYKVDKFVKQTGFEYEIAFDRRDIIEEAGIVSYPTNMVVNQEGVIEYAAIGYKTDIVNVLSYYIEKTLAKGSSD